MQYYRVTFPPLMESSVEVLGGYSYQLLRTTTRTVPYYHYFLYVVVVLVLVLVRTHTGT